LGLSPTKELRLENEEEFSVVTLTGFRVYNSNPSADLGSLHLYLINGSDDSGTTLPEKLFESIYGYGSLTGEEALTF
jgi:hypothetical protein